MIDSEMRAYFFLFSVRIVNVPRMVPALPDTTSSYPPPHSLAVRIFLSLLLAGFLYLEGIELRVLYLYTFPPSGEIYNGWWNYCAVTANGKWQLPYQIWYAVLLIGSVTLNYLLLKYILTLSKKNTAALLFSVFMATLFISAFNYGGNVVPAPTTKVDASSTAAKDGYEWKWLGVHITWIDGNGCN